MAGAEIIQICLVAFLCVYATITDIKRGQISNKLIMVFLIIGALIDFVFYKANSFLIQTFLINVAIMIIVSLLLYLTHIWAAGDSKLVIAISILYPIRFTISNAGFLLEVLIPAYAFVFSFLFLIGDSIYQTIKRKESLSINEIIAKVKRNIWSYLASCIYVLTFLKAEILLENFYDLKLGYWKILLNICLLAIISSVKILKNRYVVIGVGATSIVLSLISGVWEINLQRLGYYALVVILMIVKSYIEQYNYEEINVNDLKKGQILSTGSSILINRYKAENLPGISTEDMRSRLTDAEVAVVKELAKKKKDLRIITIVRKIPFAIFVSIGTIVFFIVGLYNVYLS